MKRFAIAIGGALCVVICQGASRKPVRLNNLVTQLVRQERAGDGTVIPFDLPRERWLFVRAVSQDGFPCVVKIDSKSVITAETPRGVAFRLVPRGRHAVTVKGRGSLTVNAIPETMVYTGGKDYEHGFEDYPVPQPSERLDWSVKERHLLPAMTTQSRGTIPADRIASFRASGRHWLANVYALDLEDDDDIGQRIRKSPGMNRPEYDGVTCDEQILNRNYDSLARYGRGLLKYEESDRPQRLVYTWHCGNVDSHDPLYSNLVHAAVCVSGGRGKLLHECYCRTKATEQEACEHLDSYIAGKVRRLREECPFEMSSYGVMFGPFDMLPGSTVVHHPEVDYKYYMEMQFRYVALNPVFDGLGLVGLWGVQCNDPDAYRWCLRLLRHYCVEGRTDSLSKKLGFRYRPGHLKNCDFDRGLADWTVVGNVTTNRFKDFGSKIGARWGGCIGIGDSLAMLSREKDEVSVLSQVAKGLVPGRTYSLQLIAADWNDVTEHRHDPRRLGLTVSVGAGAEVLSDRSYVYFDTKPLKKGTDAKKINARANIHKVYFVARSAEAEVRIDNSKARVGESIVLNDVRLRPCYEENREND